MSGSRLAIDNLGRTVCVDTTGHIWIVLPWTALGFEPRGRRPTSRERLEARAPYQDPRAAAKQWGPPPPPVDDDQLDERAAIESAYRGQQHEPADLIGRLAA
jgi:hypothetical protein